MSKHTECENLKLAKDLQPGDVILGGQNEFLRVTKIYKLPKVVSEWVRVHFISSHGDSPMFISMKANRKLQVLQEMWFE